MRNYTLNTEYGYYEIQPKPSEEELRVYYEKKYYQDEHATYERHYEPEELNYFYNKIAQKDFVVGQIIQSNNTKSLLDIGCGEGFTLDYYNKKGWEVTGVDFSDFGLKENHPHLVENLKQGNVFDEVQKLVNKGEKYDLVWLDNVLEHVINPVNLLRQCHHLTRESGVLVIEVPNDYSSFQTALLERGKVSRKYWEAYPDHLSYFTYGSLKNLCEAQGWNTRKIVADFPIEWFLTNENSNYSEKKGVGKAAHKSRVFIENFLSNYQSETPEALIDFYEAMARIGQGRQLIAFFTKK